MQRKRARFGSQGKRSYFDLMAKKTLENRGHFVTRGCYLTAEILFAAATLHQLAMFIHFPNEAGAWASP